MRFNLCGSGWCHVCPRDRHPARAVFMRLLSSVRKTPSKGKVGPSSLASLSTVPCTKDGAQSCLTHANEPCPTMVTMCAVF
eukprot:2993037-Pyramimonas_sp.AAC.1